MKTVTKAYFAMIMHCFATTITNFQVYPDSFDCTKVKKLYFSGNFITEITADELSRFTNVEEIEFIASAVIAFPKGLDCLKKLKTIEITTCPTMDLTPLFEASETFRRQIKRLKLENFSSRYATAQILKFENLTEILLPDNKFTEFPKELFSFPKLEVLDLSGNFIEDLPIEIEKLTYLKRIILANNKLASLIPPFASLQNLEYVNLNQNKFTSIPVELCFLNKLTSLFIEYNGTLVKLFPKAKEIRKSARSLFKRVKGSTDDSSRKSPIEIEQKKEVLLDFFKRKSALNAEECITCLMLKAAVIKYDLKFFEHLTSFGISGSGLTTIPKSIEMLVNCRKFYLLNGKLKSVPKELLELKKLLKLYLTNNNLEWIPYFNLMLNAKNLQLFVGKNYLSDRYLRKKGYGIKGLKEICFKSLNTEDQQTRKAELSTCSTQ